MYSGPGSQHNMPLNNPQRKIVVIAWISYAAYYLGRVNISTALPAIQKDLLFSKSQVGLIITGFFWAYAFGSLINGRLGDRLSPRRFVFTGMLISVGLNLLFGSISTWALMLIVWTLNGFFQATGWGPVLRTLANWLSPEQITRISGAFGSSFVAGNMLTWLFTGWLVSVYGWRAAFWAPATLFAVIALGWFWLVRDNPSEPGNEENPTDLENVSGIFEGLFSGVGRLWTLLLSSMMLGFVLVSLILWIPTFFVEVGQLGIGFAATLSTVLPLTGILGTLLLGWFVGKYMLGKEAKGLFFILLVLGALFVIMPNLNASLTLSVLMLALIGALAYGASSLVLATMALIQGGREAASSTAGLVDFFFNIGAGLSGGVIGAILDSQSWSVVFYVLAAASLASALFIILPNITDKSTGKEISHA